MSKHLTSWHNADTDEVHSPKGRMVYPTLLEPRAIKGEATSRPKFSVTLLLPKSANIDALKAIVAAAGKEKLGADWAKKAKSLPLHETKDFEKLKEYADEYPTFLRASANPDFPPFIYGPNTKLFAGDASEIYSGRHAVVAVRAYGYDTAGNKGVAFGLQRIQLLDHDEVIAGGRVATSSGFEAAGEEGSAPGANAGGSKPSADRLWA